MYVEYACLLVEYTISAFSHRLLESEKATRYVHPKVALRCWLHYSVGCIFNGQPDWVVLIKPKSIYAQNVA